MPKLPDIHHYTGVVTSKDGGFIITAHGPYKEPNPIIGAGIFFTALVEAMNPQEAAIKTWKSLFGKRSI